eukprot:NODE_12068_length_1247_cov_12.805357.p1 GENE.NODE_12068_length_1247_cov_12.805357~~NODE_12068_length_1247_cov_12.805357.p1  ORF type:complete len:363 (-),score=17.56 NODE_12068_length_1247_cov_12.805357:62-1150(-)
MGAVGTAAYGRVAVKLVFPAIFVVTVVRSMREAAVHYRAEASCGVLAQNASIEALDASVAAEDTSILARNTTTSPLCSQQWPRFEDGVDLTSTQVVHNPSAPRRFTHDIGVWIDPDTNFAFCPINKNSCTRWQKVLNRISHKTTKVSRASYHTAQQSFHRYGLAGYNKVFANPSSVRAVFVREPLARFASAILQKCTVHNCNSVYCSPRVDRHLPKGKPIRFRDAVEWFIKANPRHCDEHYRLQAEYCDLRHRLHEYTVVGLMTKDNLARDAMCLMNLAGVDEYNLMPDGSPMWVEGNAGHSSTESSASEEDRLKKVFTPEAARRVMKHYQPDYKLFHIPEPSWVDSATGELYEKHMACRKD